jgi:hypothetical protein
MRIGRLVSMHGLSALALNGRKELVFGPEQNGPVHTSVASGGKRRSRDITGVR